MEAPGVSIELSAVAYPDRETGRWIAHCLEMDVVSAGESSAEALSTLLELCDVQIAACLQDGDLDGIFRPAPSHIWAIYAKAKTTDLVAKRPTAVDRVTLREYSQAA